MLLDSSCFNISRGLVAGSDGSRVGSVHFARADSGLRFMAKSSAAAFVIPALFKTSRQASAGFSPDKGLVRLLNSGSQSGLVA